MAVLLQGTAPTRMSLYWLRLTHFAGSVCCCRCRRSSFWLWKLHRRYKASLWPTWLPKGGRVRRRRRHEAEMPRVQTASRHKDSGNLRLWFAGEDLNHFTRSPHVPHPPTSPFESDQMAVITGAKSELESVRRRDRPWKQGPLSTFATQALRAETEINT